MDQTLSSPTQKIKKYLLFALILSLSFGQLSRLSLASFSFYLHDPLILLYFIFSLPYLSKPRHLLPSLILFFALSFLLLNPNYLYSIRNFFYFAFFYVLLTSPLPTTKNNLQNLLTLSFSLALLIGLLQYFLLPDTRYLYFLGWDDHLNRLIFPYYDPPFTANILALSLFWTLLIQTHIFLPILIFVAFLLTYSRASFLSLALTSVFSLKNKKTSFIILILLSTALVLLPRKFGEGTNLLRTYSISARLNHDLAHLQNTHHLLWGNKLYVYPSSQFPQHAATPNNSFLYILESAGLVPLLIFFFLLFQLLNTNTHVFWLFTTISAFFNNTLFYPFVLLYLILITTHQTNSSAS